MKKKIKETIELINDIVSGEIEIPNNALVLDMEAMVQIFTKKRLELVDVIGKIKPKSVQELASAVKRTKQAVDRDLKLLERFEVVELKREGRCAIPLVKREVLVMPLCKAYA